LFADPSGNFAVALARARDVIPRIDAQVAAGADLVRATKPDFGTADAPRLAAIAVRPDGVVEITIDDDDLGCVSADLELSPDGELRLITVDET
jgi:hypothetical protein